MLTVFCPLARTHTHTLTLTGSSVSCVCVCAPLCVCVCRLPVLALMLDGRVIKQCFRHPKYHITQTHIVSTGVRNTAHKCPKQCSLLATEVQHQHRPRSMARIAKLLLRRRYIHTIRYLVQRAAVHMKKMWKIESRTLPRSPPICWQLMFRVWRSHTVRANTNGMESCTHTHKRARERSTLRLYWLDASKYFERLTIHLCFLCLRVCVCVCVRSGSVVPTVG